MKKFIIVILCIICAVTVSAGCFFGEESGTNTGGGDDPYVNTSGVEPNTWYFYRGVLYYQNCIIDDYGVSGKDVAVTYYPVCSTCHEIEAAAMPYPAALLGSIGTTSRQKEHVCENCGATTYVLFALEE